MNEPSYRYEILNGEGAIRLLSLLPGQFSDDIHVRISNTDLTKRSRPQYEALSYVWGEAIDDHFVHVDQGGPFQKLKGLLAEDRSKARLYVTSNLVEALRYLRLSNKPRVLWIDAICIDQQNIMERGQQVSLMSDIYARAERVVVWLGPASDGSTSAIKLILDVGAVVSVSLGQLHNVLSKARAGQPWMKHQKSLVTRNPEQFAAIYRLLARSWFKRLWIRQEIHLGAKNVRHNAILMCGSKSILWTLFSKGVLCCIVLRQALESPDVKGLDTECEELVYSLCKDKYLSFKELLVDARQSQCSDPRDKVYGILGMLQESDPKLQQWMKPDYSIGTSQVYSKVFKYVMMKEGNLDLLRFCDNLPDGTNTFRPTWSPNWNESPSVEAFPEQYADAGSFLAAKTQGVELLEAIGLVTTKVESVTSMTTSSRPLPEFAFEYLEEVFQSYLDYKTPIPATLLEPYCYMFNCGARWEHHETVRRYENPIEDVATELRVILGFPSRKRPQNKLVYDEMKKSISLYCRNRAIICTESGLVGIGPRSAQVGDEVAVLLGCSNLVVLRADASKVRTVVGCCYIPGLNWGEALLGPVPESVRLVRTHFEGESPGWRYKGSPDRLEELVPDPRIDWDELEERPLEWDKSQMYIKACYKGGGMKNYRRPNEYYFRRHGVQLQRFKIL